VLCRVFNKTNDHDDGLLGLYHVSSWGAGCSLLLNAAFQRIINQQMAPWDVKVTTVEIKSVALPQEMRRASVGQAEAKRERRAKVIHAEGEFEASRRLVDAADVIGWNPAAVQQRSPQTLVEISADKIPRQFSPFPSIRSPTFRKG
jgi:hypothetical protein